MKKRSKKIVETALVFLFVAVVAVCLVIAGCEPAEAKYSIDSYEKPSGLAEGQLQLEWKSRRSGQPSAIVFNDARASYGVDDLTFPEGLRTVEYNRNSDDYAPIKDNLWEYWRDNVQNIAIFHTESFAVGTSSEYYSKILNGGSFVDENGIAQGEISSVNLIKVFAYEYAAAFGNEVQKYDKAENDYDIAIPDVRFVGSGVGALYALLAADYIYGAYFEGNVSEYILPSRLALINPWFSNEEVMLNAAATVERLAGFGVAIEYIESDSEADSLFTTRQIAAHERIIAQSAYLEMRESYSGGLSEEVKEKIGMTWYLASINGSDYFRLSHEPETERHRKPVYNMPDLYYNTYNNYAVSAWTPTPYLRLLRGISFTQKTYNYDKNTVADYTSDSFRIELYQYSDKAGLRVGGYAFADANGDAVMNDGRVSGVIKNVKVELVYKDSSGTSAEEVVETTYTDERGFYLFEVGAEIYNSRNRTFYVRFQRPNYRYSYNKVSGTLTEDVGMWYSTASGDLTTIGTYYSDVNRMSRTNRLVNCGFKPANKNGDK